jgi:hypothetical protein
MAIPALAQVERRIDILMFPAIILVFLLAIIIIGVDIPLINRLRNPPGVLLVQIP